MGEIINLFERGAITFVAVLAFVLILANFFTVNTAQAAVVTRFGRFIRVANPGLNWKWPLIDRVAGRVSMRVNQIALTIETKTKDNVFVTVPISVQTRVHPDKVFDFSWLRGATMRIVYASITFLVVTGLALAVLLTLQRMMG